MPVESVPVGESQVTVWDPQDVIPSIFIPKHCQIALIPIQSPESSVPSSSSSSSNPSTKSAPYPIIVVPKFTIPADGHPEQLNQPGGRREYWCQLCTFCHLNLDCILTHVRKHLDMTTGCPICGKRFQNAASVCKHGRDVHKVQIVASANAKH